jgi:Protein of unknown function (DUF2853)
MTKFQEAIATYKSFMAEKLEMNNVNENVLVSLAQMLGNNIFDADAALVACSDKAELNGVKELFLINELGLTEKPELETAIKAVCKQMGTANRKKHRVVFYYLLLQYFGYENTYTVGVKVTATENTKKTTAAKATKVTKTDAVVTPKVTKAEATKVTKTDAVVTPKVTKAEATKVTKTDAVVTPKVTKAEATKVTKTDAVVASKVTKTEATKVTKSEATVTTPKVTKTEATKVTKREAIAEPTFVKSTTTTTTTVTTAKKAEAKVAAAPSFNSFDESYDFYTSYLYSEIGFFDVHPELLSNLINTAGENSVVNTKTETAAIKNNFLIGRLGCEDSVELDSAINTVNERMGSTPKYRAIFYYLLTVHLGKEWVITQPAVANLY